MLRRLRAYFFRVLFLAVFILLVVGVVKLISFGIGLIFGKGGEPKAEAEEPVVITMEEEPPAADETEETEEPEEPEESVSEDKATPRVYSYSEENATYMGSGEYTSNYGIVVNATDMKVVAVKNAHDRIPPASMTKILTVLVACERIEDVEDTFEVTLEDTDYSYSNDGMAAGFMDGEVVKVADLLYGTILPSGADAAHALARYVAGSHDAFVELMNEKLDELGLPDEAHFTNCVGIYSDEHYCSVYDMAVIINAAMDNPLARQVLSARTYTTSSTPQHPEGITISNWFLRRIEDKDCGGQVLGAKTGYVVQSGNCAASYFTCNDGKDYICVSADAHSSWRAIYDHVAAYNIYAAGNTGYRK